MHGTLKRECARRSRAYIRTFGGCTLTSMHNVDALVTRTTIASASGGNKTRTYTGCTGDERNVRDKFALHTGVQVHARAFTHCTSMESIRRTANE